MDRAARRREGRFYTPAPLARAVARRTVEPLLAGRSADEILGLRILDPACGDGVFLEAAWRLLADRTGRPDAARRCLTGVDTDAEALARVRAPERIHADALRHPWGDRRFDVVLGNPPWISYSGRHAQALPDAARADLARRYETFRGWPSLHGPFVELAVRLASARAGLLIPTQVCDLERYGGVREFVRRHARVDEPVIDCGESAFEGVTQPCCGWILELREGGGTGGRAPFALAPGAGQDGLLEHLDRYPRPPARAFGDVGVHTGNCAAKLLDSGGLPLREGRDVHAFRLDAPRRTLRPDAPLEDGEYCRFGPLETYREVPVLLRQTALRPVAALHTEPGYFRNSVLACRGLDGVPDELVVAWLNSSVVAWFHRARVREARQRTFPQLKVRHLRDLPMPRWERVDPGLPRLVARDGRLDLAPDLDREVSRWFGLDDDAHARLA